MTTCKTGLDDLAVWIRLKVQVYLIKSEGNTTMRPHLTGARAEMDGTQSWCITVIAILYIAPYYALDMQQHIECNVL